MLNETSTSINPAVSIESDPVFGIQNQQELSLTSNLDTQFIEQTAARIASSSLSALPDLTITNRTLSSPIYAGDSVNFTYTIKNSGKATATNSTTKFWLSQDRLWDSSDTLLSSDEVGSLNVGQSSIESASLNISAAQAAGRYYILMQADANNSVVETNENNNIRIAPVTIKTKTDVAITNVEVIPESVIAGDQVTIRYTESNVSNTLAGRHQTAIYLSQDEIFDSSDVRYTVIEERALAIGASRTTSKTLTVDPSLATGEYYFLVVGDSGNVLVESDENNNIGSGYSAIAGRPDLTISNIFVPTTVRPGERITLDYTEHNLGIEASSSYSTYFYLSTDNVFDPATDTYLTHTSNYEGIDAGGSFDNSVDITANASLALGTYYVFGVSDPHNHIVESNETNNASILQMITIAGEPIEGPDLVISNVSSISVGSYQTSLGTYITLADAYFTVLNQGTAHTGNSSYYPYMYLSTDRFLDSSDIAVTLGTFGSTTPLAAGESRNSFITSDTYNIPEGNYYVLLRIDITDSIVEIDESNNVWSSNRTYDIPG